MKYSNRLCLVWLTGCALFVLCPTAALAGEDAKEEAAEVSVSWKKDTCVYASGQWELRIRYLLRGTRSEGQDGKLYNAGVEVPPKEDGETLDTPIGKLKHHGTERKVRWAISGWNFAARKDIRSSGDVKVTEE